MLAFSVLLLASSALAAPVEQPYARNVFIKPQPQPLGRHTEQVVVGVRQPQMSYQTRGFNSKIIPLSINQNSDHVNVVPKSTVVAQGVVPVAVPKVQVPVQARHNVPDFEAGVGVIKEGVFQQGEAVSNDPAASARVVQQDTEVNFDGSFRNVWNSDNGINVQEQGEVKHVGDSDVAVQKGEISYVDNDGNEFHLKYVADENGFHVEGDHLPTPPPIPAEIARSLEFIAAHPYVETTTMSEEEQEQQQQRQPGQTLDDPMPIVEDN